MLPAAIGTTAKQNNETEWRLVYIKCPIGIGYQKE